MAFSHRVALSASLKITVFRVEVLTNGEPYKIDAAPFTVRGSIYIHIYIYNIYIYICVSITQLRGLRYFFGGSLHPYVAWALKSICDLHRVLPMGVYPFLAK